MVKYLQLKNWGNIQITLLVTIIQFLFVYYFFGFHYVWVDELFIDLLFKKQVLCVGINEKFLPVFFLLDKLFYFLYESVLTVPWMGIFYIFLLLVSVFNINYLIYSNFNQKFGYQILISFLLILGLFLKLIVYPNYTSTALVVALSTFIIYSIKSEEIVASKGLLFLLFFIFNLGFLLRPPVVLLGCFVFLIIIYVNSGRKVMFRTAYLPIISFLFYFIVGLAIIINQDLSHYVLDYKRSKILDTNIEYDFKKIEDEKLKAFSEAYASWFYADSGIFENVEYIDQMLTHEVKRGFFNKHSNKLSKEIKKISTFYSKEYHQGLNWNIELLIILPLLLLLVGFQIKSSNKKTITFLLNVLLFFLLFLIVLLYKLEYRFFYPILFFALLYNILYHVKHKSILYLILVLFFNLTIYQLISVKITVKESDKENKAITTTLEAIKTTFASETVIFEMLSTTILHNELLSNIELEDNWISISEIQNLGSKGHKEKLSLIFGCPQFTCIAEKATNNKDYVFLFSESRVKIIENYFKFFYNDDINFVKHPNSEDILDVEYSIFNTPTNIHLYYLEYCSK